MSISTETAVASIEGRVLSLEQLLRTLQLEGSLLPALRRAIVRQLIHHYAEEQGFRTSDDQLQRAADQFRRKHGLLASTGMQQWLDNRRLSLFDFQSILEWKLERQFVMSTLTSNAEEQFNLDCHAWDKVCFRCLEVASEQLADELKCQHLEDGLDLTQLVAELSRTTSGDHEILVRTCSRYEVPVWLQSAISESNCGSLIGPLACPSGWALVFVEEVTPAVFDAETEAAIRKHLFQQWLSARMQESKISYPLLDLLSCSNDS
jgi:hypothetical protein